METYNIIDNGYTAFVATIDTHAQSVSVKVPQHYEDVPKGNILEIPRFLKMWVGNNRPRTQTAYGDLKNLKENVYYDPSDEDNIGNCLLFQVTPLGYILVTMEILYFETYDPVTDFFSAITNNGMIVPIVVCQDSVIGTYFTERKYPKTDLTMDPLFHSHDDDCCAEGKKLKPCTYLVGRLYDEVRGKNEVEPAVWNNGLFKTACFSSGQSKKLPDLSALCV